MSITENADGTFRFDYELNVVPCKNCGGTDIILYEEGGTSLHAHRREPAKGGGICKKCSHNVVREGLPLVPSMSMLLDIWNNANK
jgi:hypothetical protein